MVAAFGGFCCLVLFGVFFRLKVIVLKCNSAVTGFLLEIHKQNAQETISKRMIALFELYLKLVTLGLSESQIKKNENKFLMVMLFII